MQLEEGFWVELLRIKSISLLPDLPQLSHAALSVVKCRRTKRNM